jgi:hypothetical protein
MAFPHCQLASVAYQVNQVASAIEGLLDTQTNEMFKAQKEMSIFQSESCLNRKVLIAVVKATRGKNQQNSKKDIMKLNALKYTKCFELMSEEEIIDLLI